MKKLEEQLAHYVGSRLWRSTRGALVVLLCCHVGERLVGAKAAERTLNQEFTPPL